MNLIPDSYSTYVTAHEKGQIAELTAQKFFIYRGWEMSTPVNTSSPYDLVIRHPRTGEQKLVQVKALTSKNRSIETYGTGNGKDKGSKRRKTDYAKIGIDILFGVDVDNSDNVYLYPLDFYRGKSSINVDKNPSHDVEFITERGYRNYKMFEETATLDLVTHDES